MRLGYMSSAIDLHCDAKVANRNARDFGWEMSSRGRFVTPADISPRIVARTEGYTYAANVWDLSLVQGPFSVAPCQTFANSRVRHFFHRCALVCRGGGLHGGTTLARRPPYSPALTHGLGLCLCAASARVGAGGGAARGFGARRGSAGGRDALCSHGGAWALCLD
jgi:hypothetical protein